MSLHTLVDSLQSELPVFGHLNRHGAAEYHQRNREVAQHLERQAQEAVGKSLKASVASPQGLPDVSRHRGQILTFRGILPSNLDKLDATIQGVVERAEDYDGRALQMQRSLAWKPQDFLDETKFPDLFWETLRFEQVVKQTDTTSEIRGLVHGRHGPSLGFDGLDHQIGLESSMIHLRGSAREGLRKQVGHLAKVLGMDPTNLHRRYLPGTGKRFREMQRGAQAIMGYDIGVVPGRVEVSAQEAETKIRAELDVIYECFKWVNEAPYINSHMVRGELIGRLARERFADLDVNLMHDHQMPAETYVSQLQAQGYRPVREGHPNSVDAGSTTWEQKQWHLYNFIKQAHEDDPSILQEAVGNSFENSREFYAYTVGHLQMSVEGQLSRGFPTKATWGTLNLYDNPEIDRGNRGNGIRVGHYRTQRGPPEVEIRINIGNPLMLELQEELCDDLGIKFGGM